ERSMRTKSTEIGMIPTDWTVKQMDEMAISISSGRSKTSFGAGEFPVYGSTGIIGYSGSGDYQGNKVLIARVGVNAGTVNKVNGMYGVTDNTLMVTYKKDIDVDFSYYQLTNFKLNRMIFGSGQPLITGSQIKRIKFAIPSSRSEQTAIAGVLLD